MTSPRRIPGLPFEITDDIIMLVGRMATLDPLSTPSVEPFFLASFWGVDDFVNISGPPACGKTQLAADIIVGAAITARMPLMPLFQTTIAAIASLAEALHREVGR